MSKKIKKLIVVVFFVLASSATILSFLDYYNCCNFRNKIGIINSSSNLIDFLTLIILLLTFLAIAWYTDETKKLREETQKRTEYEFRPFFIFEIDGKRVLIRNIGKGLAYDYNVYGDDEKMVLDNKSKILKVKEHDNIENVVLKKFKKISKINIISKDTLGNRWKFFYTIHDDGQAEFKKVIKV